MIYSSNKSIIKEKKEALLFIFREGKNRSFLYGREGGEIRLPFIFFHFLILYSAIPTNLFLVLLILILLSLLC
jgi:hypothetical protein